MRNLLKVCVLGILAFGLSACDKVSDVKETISFFMTKQCENGEDKIKGCAEVKEMAFKQDIIKTQTQYKDGKKIYERHIGNGAITSKRYLEQIDNKYIVRTVLPDEHSETRCVSAENAIDKEEYLVCSFAEHTKWKKLTAMAKYMKIANLVEILHLADNMSMVYVKFALMICNVLVMAKGLLAMSKKSKNCFHKILAIFINDAFAHTAGIRVMKYIPRLVENNKRRKNYERKIHNYV